MLRNLCCLAPLCPKPPDAKVEGVMEYHPLPIPLIPEKICALDSEDIYLQCPSFLSIYVLNVEYGRNQSKGKVLCDGEKPNDSLQPTANCFNETFNNELRHSMAETCHGTYNCSFFIPTVPLTSVCDAMKREVRIDYICGR